MKRTLIAAAALIALAGCSGDNGKPTAEGLGSKLEAAQVQLRVSNEQYLESTQKRCVDLASDDAMAAFVAGDIQINGKDSPSLKAAQVAMDYVCPDQGERLRKFANQAG